MNLTKELLIDFHLECNEKVSQFKESVKFDCNIPINSGMFQLNAEEDCILNNEGVIEGFNGTSFYFIENDKEICLVNFEGLSLDNKIDLIEEYLSSKNNDNLGN